MVYWKISGKNVRIVKTTHFCQFTPNFGDYFHIICMVYLSRSFKSFMKQFLILQFYHVLVLNRPIGGQQKREKYPRKCRKVVWACDDEYVGHTVTVMDVEGRGKGRPERRWKDSIKHDWR